MQNASSNLAQIIALATSGQTDIAKQECEKYLIEQPENATGWNLLGALRLQSQQIDPAKLAFIKAIELDPLLTKAHHNLGTAYATDNKTDLAIASYRQALAIDNQSAATHFALGTLFKQSGGLTEAIHHLSFAVSLTPHQDWLTQLANTLQQSGDQEKAKEVLEAHYPAFADNTHFLNDLGNARLEVGDFVGAEQAYRQALSIAPAHAISHNNLGVTLLKQLRHTEAAAALRQAVALAPDNPDFASSLGCALTDLGNTEESIPLLEQSTTRWPDNINGLTNLGLAYITARQPERAIESLARALELSPNDPEAHNNLGAAYEALDKIEQASLSYHQAITLRPEYPQPYNNLGNTALAKLDLDEASTCYRQAIKLDPGLADAHMNLGLVHLLRGECEAGWAEYEWRRYATSEKHKYQTFTQPEWQGEALAGSTILLHAEQGFGDTIQFIRYATLVKDLGTTVIVQCQPALKRLLKAAAGVDLLIGSNETLPEFDIQTPLLSLPHLFKTKINTIPSPLPYLTADTAMTRSWGQRLAGESRLKIGLVWAGNPTHRNNRNRSCTLERFLPLTKIPGTVFFSLQKGDPSNELSQLAPNQRINIIDYTDGLDDFSDSAALLANLDLLITVDTSVAHLAGAIGIPTWVALPYSPDWRWLLDRTDSPWYSNLRLFRQPSIGDWASVFDPMGKALLSYKKDNPRPFPNEGYMTHKNTDY